MSGWTFEQVSTGHAFSEGPQWTGDSILFTDLYNHRILRFDPASGRTECYFQGVLQGNGLLYSQSRRLYCCEMVGRCVSEIGPGRRVVVDSHAGRRLNSPNDITEDSAGRLWFTDPRYGHIRRDMELDHESIFRYDPAGDGLTRLTFDTTRPNGLLLSADEKTLYVAQSDYGEAAKRELRAYPVLPDQTLGPHRVLHNFFPGRGVDGMALSDTGHVLAVSGWAVSGQGPMITVFEDSGRVTETQPTPYPVPTNICFGGPDLSDLYLTAGDGCLYRVADSGYRGAERYRR